ncbi:MAG TPA: UDP-3-O-(3-hydroxymyristoyl)glucosamine N-acyltransferase [Terriglobia bacterium]|nr:UDP-3-O-(3-hydroxymyristoyl)glucosamine N-acyltransferase [Terriglobia bacterium]
MKVREIAGLVGGEATGDREKDITGVAALDAATERDLAFAEGEFALRRAADSCAGCILVPEDVSVPGRTIITVRNLRLAFIRAAEALHPPRQPQAGVHPTAVVAADAHLAPGVSVGPYCVIEAGVKVGEGTCLSAGVYLGEAVSLGGRCVLHARVSVYPGVQIGDRVILHAGVVLGSDGFGYLFAEGRQQKFPQLGGLVIENDVEIGSNTTVDRGSLGTTRIGEGVKIDNLVQIAHNVKIGRHSVVAAQTGISGSTQIGDFVTLAGQAGVGDHVRIEDGVVIGGQAGILPGKSVRKGSVVWGTPARPLSEFKKMYAHLSRLPALAQKVKELSASLPRKK